MRRVVGVGAAAALLLLAGCKREASALESCVDARLAEQGAVFTGAKHGEQQIERDAQREACRAELEKGRNQASGTGA